MLYISIKRKAYKTKFSNYLLETGGVKNQFKCTREFKNAGGSFDSSSLSRVLTVLGFMRRLIVWRARGVLSNISINRLSINRVEINSLNFRDLA